MILNFYPLDYFLTEKEKRKINEFDGNINNLHQAKMWELFAKTQQEVEK